MTLQRLDEESARAENQALRPGLLPSLAFYRGACLAALDREQEARAEFEIFLAHQPNASLDPAVYPKKVIRQFEATRKALSRGGEQPDESGSLAAAYRAFPRSAANSQEAPREDWAEGPAGFLLTPEEKRAFRQLSDPVSRSEFVTNFWKLRDPKQETTQNEFREELEKRVAFADSYFAQDETRGSLTDRGMVFLLLGPPTYAGRKPLTTGEDVSDNSGLSRYTRHDLAAARAQGGTTSQQAARMDQIAHPTATILEASDNWREVWHYRKELLPKSVLYQQVDFEFLTRKGYGNNVLQREEAALNTLEAARRALSLRHSK